MFHWGKWTFSSASVITLMKLLFFLYSALTECSDLHFWAWPAARKGRCPFCRPAMSMSLQGGSLVRPNNCWTALGLHGSIEVWSKQGHRQDMVAPGGASCRLPTSHPLHGGIRRCDTQGRERGHFEGYRPARSCREVGLVERSRKKTDMAISCFHKIEVFRALSIGHI